MERRDVSDFGYIMQAEPKGHGNVSDMGSKMKKNDYKIFDLSNQQCGAIIQEGGRQWKSRFQREELQFDSGLTKSDLPIRYKNGDFELAIGYINLEFRGQACLGDQNLETLSFVID